MGPVEKAVWYIESHFAEPLTLDGLAEEAGVSRFHLARAFAAATGQSAIRYLRGRRLSEAAKALAAGAPDILATALEAGYGSHEAFTRAFRDQFGTTPESVRALRCLDSLQLVEPIKMDESLILDLARPVIAKSKPLLVAGLGERYTSDSSKAVPALWQKFQPHLGHVPGQIGAVAYGVIHNVDDDDNFDYIAGVEVADFSALTGEFARVRIPAQTYAVFTHHDHISSIRRVFHTIWSKSLPEGAYKPADAPIFERYGPEFDGHTGMGGFQIWVPIKG
jgi:AraC family transcriptional regulator